MAGFEVGRLWNITILKATHAFKVYLISIYLYNIDPGKPAAEVPQT